MDPTIYMNWASKQAVARGLKDPSFRVIQNHFAISGNLGDVAAKVRNFFNHTSHNKLIHTMTVKRYSHDLTLFSVLTFHESCLFSFGKENALLITD